MPKRHSSADQPDRCPMLAVRLLGSREQSVAQPVSHQMRADRLITLSFLTEKGEVGLQFPARFIAQRSSDCRCIHTAADPGSFASFGRRDARDEPCFSQPRASLGGVIEYLLPGSVGEDLCPKTQTSDGRAEAWTLLPEVPEHSPGGALTCYFRQETGADHGKQTLQQTREQTLEQTQLHVCQQPRRKALAHGFGRSCKDALTHDF